MGEPEQPQIPLAVIAGPTASGKTALAVQLAHRLGGEIISADSMQLYRELRIGTARPTDEETEGVPHHLMGCVPMAQPYSVAEYVRQARRIAAEIDARGHLPIVAGGTGLYISALADGLSFSESPQDEALRAELTARARREGGEALLRELAQFDPESAARLHPNNLGRIVRAIEIYRLSGVTMTEQLRRSRENPPPWRLSMIGLSFRDRAALYRRIDRRAEQMMADGLEDEARRALASPSAQTALQAIGYKELAPYLRGECTRAEALERLQRATRHYAKRQLTWFRRDARVHWLFAEDYPAPGALADEAERILRAELNWTKGGTPACRTE